MKFRYLAVCLLGGAAVLGACGESKQESAGLNAKKDDTAFLNLDGLAPKKIPVELENGKLTAHGIRRWCWLHMSVVDPEVEASGWIKTWTTNKCDAGYKKLLADIAATPANKEALIKEFREKPVQDKDTKEFNLAKDANGKILTFIGGSDILHSKAEKFVNKCDAYVTAKTALFRTQMRRINKLNASVEACRTGTCPTAEEACAVADLKD